MKIEIAIDDNNFRFWANSVNRSVLDLLGRQLVQNANKIKIYPPESETPVAVLKDRETGNHYDKLDEYYRNR